MFSFLFLKKNRHPSSSTISNQEPSRNLLLQINSLKEENQRFIICFVYRNMNFNLNLKEKYTN